MAELVVKVVDDRGVEVEGSIDYIEDALYVVDNEGRRWSMDLEEGDTEDMLIPYGELELVEDDEGDEAA